MALKMAPRRLEEGQSCPERAQDGRKISNAGARCTQDGLRWAQVASGVLQEDPEEGPTMPKSLIFI
eukprot:4407004-Pyramimonas_sp.AAC.1